MYRNHTVGVVIPAYNEEGLVGPTIRSVPKYVDRIYVIDDGSTDDTWNEITETATRENERRRSEPDVHPFFDDQVVPIQHDENRGVGGAIKTGYLRARDEALDVTAVMGGDGQMEPEIFESLCDPIVDGRAEYVKGNRFADRTERGSMPAFRYVGNAILASLTKVASGYWRIGDPQSGFTTISLHALESAAIEDMYEFYGYCNDLLVKLNVAGLRVVDIPRPITYGDEESSIRYRTYIPRVSGMLFRNFLWRLRVNYLTFDFHPLVIAYLAGGLASGAGLLGLASSLPGFGAPSSAVVRGLLGLLLVLVGMLSFVAAMVLDKRENDHLNAVIDPSITATPTPPAGEREHSWVGDGDRPTSGPPPSTRGMPTMHEASGPYSGGAGPNGAASHGVLGHTGEKHHNTDEWWASERTDFESSDGPAT